MSEQVKPEGFPEEPKTPDNDQNRLAQIKAGIAALERAIQEDNGVTDTAPKAAPSAQESPAQERAMAEEAADRIKSQAAKLEATERENARLREALRGMLDHACVADAAPEDVDEEDRQRERAARTALESKP